jgi:hypothetical protein
MLVSASAFGSLMSPGTRTIEVILAWRSSYLAMDTRQCTEIVYDVA